MIIRRLSVSNNNDEFKIETFVRRFAIEEVHRERMIVERGTMMTEDGERGRESGRKGIQRSLR